MKKLIAGVLLALSASFVISTQATASSAGPALENAGVDLHNQASLRRGAKYFVNYCMGCHALSYSRYNRVAQDLGFTDKQAAENLIFTRTDGEPSKPGELMKNGISPKDAAEWFGAAPPDLTLNARVRSPDWIYTYLKSFYVDKTRPMGVNNTVFPNVGMPHVLWELQGLNEKVCTKEEGKKGEHAAEHCTMQPVKAGKLSGAEYDQVVRDITGFLTYVSEPGQTKRPIYGMFALLFLAVFAGVAYLLKKEYWKDIH